MSKICQSCGMPMKDATLYGVNADGKKNEEYCKFCYPNGAFKNPDETMKEMIDTCIPFMVKEGMEEGQSREMLEQTLPTLKRWKNVAE